DWSSDVCSSYLFFVILFFKILLAIGCACSSEDQSIFNNLSYIFNFNQKRKNDSIGKINTVAPPTSTLTGLGIYESAFPPIGEIGATICSRCEQLSFIIDKASSTCSSSQPIINVVFPSFKNPPVVASFVVW